MIDGKIKGYFLLGQNPAVGSAHGRAQRLGMANLDWLVVRDLFVIESATFWKNGPEIETGEIVPEECRTEVFFLPAASHVEKEGTFTQTQRMLQWREKAVDPPGDCPLRAVVLLPPRPAGPGAAGRLDRCRATGPLLDLAWDYPMHGPHDEPSAEAVLQEINGYEVADRPAAVRLRRAARRRLHRRRLLDLHRRVRRRRQPGGPAQARQRAGLGGAGVGLGVAGEPAHPLQPRLRRPGRPAVERAQGATSGGTPRRGEWTGHDVPDFEKTKPPTYRPPEGASGPAALAGDDPFIMQGDGKGWLYVPAGLVDGPMPTHYEPAESPVRNPLYGQQANPTRKVYPRAGQPDATRAAGAHSDVFPYVFTTSRLTEHHTAGGMSRTLAYLSELQPAMFVEVSPELAAERGLTHLGWAHVVTARAVIEARVLVTDRLRPLRVDGRIIHQIWLPYHWGSAGLVTGDSANDLFGITLDPNVLIQESKVGTCDVRPGRRPTGPALLDYVADYRAAGPACAPSTADGEPIGGRPRNSLYGPLDPAPDAGYVDAPPRMGFFTDTSVCIGCKACEVACKEWNGVPDDGFTCSACRSTTPAR